ncbi:MAG: hypothetical protein ACREBW_02315 [Candidatus Micrarchaeaceae archaeon]
MNIFKSKESKFSDETTKSITLLCDSHRVAVPVIMMLFDECEDEGEAKQAINNIRSAAPSSFDLVSAYLEVFRSDITALKNCIVKGRLDQALRQHKMTQ